MSHAMTGKCLCGAVTVTLPHRVNEVGVCHCTMCRRWCSGPWMALTAPTRTRITGDSLKQYQSSWAAERGFCGVCGCLIFHRPRDGPELAVSAGLFDSHDFCITHEICHDAKPPYYRFDAASERRSSARLAVVWLPRLIARRIRRLFRKEPA